MCAVVFADPSLSVESQSSRIWTHPEFPAVVITGSWAPLHTSRAGSSGYSASFLAMRSSTLIIVVGASVSNSYFDVMEAATYRRLHLGRPLILPIYLSSPSFNFVAMSSYDHSCFLQHIRFSAFPYVNSSAILQQRDRCAMRLQRCVIFMHRTFRRDAPPARRPGSRALALALQS